MSMERASLMKNAQTEKTRQTVDQLVEWYSTKEEFYKTYFPIQRSIAKHLIVAAQLTANRLKEVANIVKEERQIQAFVFEKSEKNTLNTLETFQPKLEEAVDEKGAKTKVQLPPWSSNIDRIFFSLNKHQKEKQGQIKKIYKTLEQIEDSLGKEQGKYKNEIKKGEKQLEQLFGRLDEAEKEESKILGKLIKESKSEPMKESGFFIGELKKMESNVMGELQLFAERGKRITDFIQALLKLEKEAAKKIKEVMTSFLNYRKNFLGMDTKSEADIWEQVSLCEEKVEIERVSYFNKTLLKNEQLAKLKVLLPEFESKNNWQLIVKFLQIPKEGLVEKIKASKSMALFLKNISYRCWSEIALAQGWLIESYTASVMYMTYDHIMIIYSQEGEFLKRIVTSASKITNIQGNTIFLQERVKGFFSDSLEEYKVKFEDSERLEEFQLFMDNQIL